jgi:class 3 adenylate cyclase
MVLDMCGFSRLTVRHGITHFLAMIHRLHRTVGPLVARGGGQIVKTEADNVFAVFKDVRPALDSARTIQAQLAMSNRVLPEDWDLHVAIGIGYGELLVVGDHDIFGSEMNLASKLGEDVGGGGDVYLTEAAHTRLGKAAGFERREIRLSGMTVYAYRAPPPA